MENPVSKILKTTRKPKPGLVLGLLVLATFGGVSSAQAGVFNLPHFVAPGDFAIGLEPELILTHGAGVATNFKYTQGINDLMNFTGILGTGSGPRQFRVGGNFAFDFFPDIEGQPGIGFATQLIYYRIPDTSQYEVTAIPYIHKTFPSDGNEIEPFLAIPIGMTFTDGQYKAISTVTIGSLFKSNEHIRYSLEFGIAVNNTESYVSGGFIYYP